jgi:hypothetical protein
MGKKEELTDVISPEGIKALKVGQILGFSYEGSPIRIKITRKDTKNMRIWGEHIDLVNIDTGMSHYGHIIDASDEARKKYGNVYCHDCHVTVDKKATWFGNKQADARYAAEVRKQNKGKGKKK